jgi:hypothetical protein
MPTRHQSLLKAASRDLLNLVGDCVFRDPEITFFKNSLDVEA